MRRIVSLALGVAFTALLAPSSASTQATIGVGAGAMFPMSDYGDVAKTGWLGHAGVNFDVGCAGAVVGAHGFYGSSSHDVDGDKTNLYGALGALGYSFGTSGSVVPQVFGMVGFMTRQYKSDSFPLNEVSGSAMAAGAGATLGFPIGGIMGAVQGYFLTGFGNLDTTRLFGADFSVAFPLDGGGM